MKKAQQTVSNLISIDGVDGSGKSSLARLLAQNLNFAKVVRPACFKETPASRLIGEEFYKEEKSLIPHSKIHNDFFLRTMEANYSTLIWPTISCGKWVVVDSSEIRALAFMLDKGSAEAINETKQRIISGQLTFGMHPKWRIVLSGEIEDLWNNLSTKDELDVGDPKSLAETRKRIEAYDRAIDFVRGFSPPDCMWLRKTITHCNFLVKKYFEQTILDLMATILKK